MTMMNGILDPDNTWITECKPIDSSDKNDTKLPELHDEHYRASIVEPILVMQQFFTKEELKGFLKGNILKYRLRFGHKEGETERDLDKIKVYEQWLSNVENGKPIEV